MPRSSHDFEAYLGSEGADPASSPELPAESPRHSRRPRPPASRFSGRRGLERRRPRQKTYTPVRTSRRKNRRPVPNGRNNDDRIRSKSPGSKSPTSGSTRLLASSIFFERGFARKRFPDADTIRDVSSEDATRPPATPRPFVSVRN